MTPVNPVPPPRVAGGGTREVFTHVHLRFLHERSSANALIKKDLPEVCPLSSRVSPQLWPYPFHYRTTFACSSIFYPPPPSAFLTVRLPFPWQQYGLTVFRIVDTNGVGSDYSPAALLSVCSYMKKKQPAAHLLVQATQHLQPVSSNEVYHRFTCVNLPIKPSPRSALVLADQRTTSRHSPGLRRGTLS